MAKQQVVDYIKSNLDKKIPLEKIRSDLYKAGWSEKDIKEAIASVYSKPAAPAAGNTQPSLSYDKKKFSVIIIIIAIAGFASYYLVSNYILSNAPALPPEIVTPNVSCGDGVCSGQETYEICPADCPPPAVNTDVKISLSPQQAAVNNGDSVTFQIQISSVSNLYGFQFDVNYNQALLEFSQSAAGDFLKKDGTSPFCVDPKVTQGTQENRITIACTRMGPVGGVDGDGVLGSVTFRALGSGTAQPKLSNVKLSDSNVRQINVQVQG